MPRTGSGAGKLLNGARAAFGSSSAAPVALRLGMAVDTVDLMSLWLAYRSGRARPVALTVLSVLGAAAVGLGYLAEADARRAGVRLGGAR